MIFDIEDGMAKRIVSGSDVDRVMINQEGKISLNNIYSSGMVSCGGLIQRDDFDATDWEVITVFGGADFGGKS